MIFFVLLRRELDFGAPEDLIFGCPSQGLHLGSLVELFGASFGVHLIVSRAFSEFLELSFGVKSPLNIKTQLKSKK